MVMMEHKKHNRLQVQDLADIPDFGLKAEELEGAQKFLSKLADIRFSDHLLSLIIEGDYLDLVGGLKMIANTQDEFASTRRIGKEKLTRRVFGTGLIGLIFTGATALMWNNVYSPQAVEKKKDEAERLKIAQQQKSLQLENNFVLGIEPTRYSDYGWRFRYPIIDKNVDYYIDEKKSTYQIAFGKALWFPTDNTENDARFYTNIRIDEFIKSNGESTPKLTIQGNDFVDEWLLKTQKSEELDTRVLIFESNRASNSRLISIVKPPLTAVNYYNVTLVKRGSPLK